MASHKDVSVLAYEKKLEHNPVSLVFSRLADCYRKRGDIQQAIDVCSSGLAHHPDSITGRIILGRCYLEQEKLKEALQEFLTVIGRDRGNQVAVKMLADIYARQGMKDQAGDLYAYLFARDPDNPSLENLTKSYGGTGKPNIYEILGFSLPKSDAVKASGRDILADNGGSVQAPARVDTAFDKTLQFDAEELTAGAAPQETGAFAQTLQYDAEELKAGSGGYEVEEVVSDVSHGENETITGDDVSDRMAMMFEEEGPTTGTTDFVSEAIGTSRENAAGPAPAASLDAVTPPSPVLEISGSDISSRIDQLFIEKREEAAGSLQDYTQMFDAPPLQESGTPLSVDTGEEPVNPEVLSKAASSDISGEDVVSRMMEMFERPGEKGSQEVVAILPESGEAIETPPTMPLEEVSEEARPSDGVSQEAAIAEAPRSDGAETPEVVFEITAQPGIPDASISGDDIAQRLESIFEEEPVVVQAPMETAATPSAPRSSEEDVAFLLSDIEDAIDGAMAAEATVIQEPASGEGEPAAEGAVFDNERKEIEDTATEDAMEATIQETVEKLDDTLPAEDTPEMSGNDVLTRLDELFPESMLTDETLAMVAEIPEGDKDEESVSHGFYTMSGENAETAQSKEPLLEKLDDVEIEIPFKADDMEEIVADKDVFAEHPKASSEAEMPKDYSIPDHVLTPTLADIYFQQGQPLLAVEIYERLLRKDPDNERIRRRIDEIKKHIALNGEHTPVKKGKPEAKKAPAARGKRTDSSAQTPKPLAGVHIKKKFKKKPKER
jgi:tetratricopeptide (TPR) repeat protein